MLAHLFLALVVHVVHPGEYLSMIAPQYGVSWQSIAQANHLANPNLIYPDQQLIIPSESGGPAIVVTPSQPKPAQASGNVEQLIIDAFGPAANRALAIARCESGLNPNAYNPQAVAGGQHAQGLFQFLPSTWAETPYRDYSMYNAWASANAAAWLYKRDGYSFREWSCNSMV